MNTFAENFIDNSIRTTTVNGCSTYKTTLNCNLDFFSQASAMRNDNENIKNLFYNAWNENKILAIRNLFYLRDIRGGQGERSSFRYVFNSLVEKLSENEYKSIISFIPEYGRWDDLLNNLQYLVNCNKEKYKEYINICLQYIQSQLNEDIKNYQENKSISLLAKWFPLENNTKNEKKKSFARFLSKMFFNSSKHCRITIVELRKYLHIVEKYMSDNKWSDIDYSTVPSKANLKYKNSFFRHDNERYSKYIQDVIAGKKKINSNTLYPYEIVSKVLSNEYDEQLEALWKNLPNYINDNSAIVVVDTSGSMYSGRTNILPIEVSISLGLYYSERNTGPFKDMFFTFSEYPFAQYVKGSTLKERVKGMSNAKFGFNTNIFKVFELYLSIAKKSSPKDLPKSIIIISDMEFDACTENPDYTAFEKIKEMFNEENIQVPTLVFWNVNSSGVNVPVKYNENNTILISGMSPSILQYVMEGKTPEEFMLDVLSSERYDRITL